MIVFWDIEGVFLNEKDEESPDIEFVYNDTDSTAAELAELYSYTEQVTSSNRNSGIVCISHLWNFDQFIHQFNLFCDEVLWNQSWSNESLLSNPVCDSLMIS